MSVSVKADDWIIIDGMFREGCYRAVKATEKMVVYRDHTWGGRETRTELRRVIFAGPEELAKRTHEQLKSSRAVMDDEYRRSSERRRERDGKILAEAAEAIKDATKP